MSKQSQFDPDLEAEESQGLTDEALADHWARISLRVEHGEGPISERLIASAYGALDCWQTCHRTSLDRRLDHGIDSAFRLLCEHVCRQEESAAEYVLRIAGYFKSQSIFVAFTAVRQFEYRIQEHRHRVLDQLVELAAARELPPSPVGMTLGGIAFLQLFLHDPAYATWPQLQRARDECIYGCFHWTVSGNNVSGVRFAELGEEIASYGVSGA